MTEHLIFLQYLQVYNPTGFNKIEKAVKHHGKQVNVTVWDTSGERNEFFILF